MRDRDVILVTRALLGEFHSIPGRARVAGRKVHHRAIHLPDELHGQPLLVEQPGLNRSREALDAHGYGFTKIMVRPPSVVLMF